MRGPAALLALLLLPAGLTPAYGWGDPYARMARKLTEDLGKWSGKTAAVVAFRWSDGRPSAGGAAVAAALETEIVERGELKLVARAELDKVLEELHLQSAGLVPADSALKIGKLSGADLLVTGTLTPAARRKVEVHARLIRVETGEVLRAVKIRVRRSWPEPPPETAGAPPGAEPVRITLSAAGFAGASRRVAGRSLAFRYADQGGRPVVRVTDYTDRTRPVWKEVPIRYEPRTNTYGRFDRGFRLEGRSYRIWSDLQSNLHLAPRGGFLGFDLDEENEVVVSMEKVFKSWIEDIEARMKELRRYPGPPKRKVLAYIEPLDGMEIRVSIFSAFDREGSDEYVLEYAPHDVHVMKGRSGKAVTSRLLFDGTAYYRFRYDADSRQVTIAGN